MGLYDRDYAQQQDESRSPFQPQMQLGLPPLTQAVKGLIFTNIAFYLINVITSNPAQPGLGFFDRIFSLYPATPLLTLQLWRLITYQFLHGGFGHILFNMLGLFFLGPPLETKWGARKFLTFYLSCGVAGGVFYIFLVYVGFLPAAHLVGASGAILGVLTACAILFPQARAFLFPFPFSVSIRVIAIIFICISFLTILSKGANAGGEAAHLAGIVAGALYVFSDSWRIAFKLRFKASRWERYVESERKLHIEVDRVLKKVHDSGLHSLSASEKRILKKATKLEQSRSKL